MVGRPQPVLLPSCGNKRLTGGNVECVSALSEDLKAKRAEISLIFTAHTTSGTARRERHVLVLLHPPIRGLLPTVTLSFPPSGTYFTHEAKGADDAADADTAIINAEGGHTNSEEKKEYYI